MTSADQHYIDLYVKRRRLMSLDAQKNASDINILTDKLKALRAHGGISQAALTLAPYVPWR